MKKNKIGIYLLALTLTFISCEEEMKELLETDFKVIEFYYGYDNYMTNVRDNKKSEPMIIRERNFLEINVYKNGDFELEGKIVQPNLIVSELKKYLIPSPDNKEMPETIEQEFTYAGKVITNKNLFISALFDNNLNYKKYNTIRNKIFIAYNEVRNEFAIKKYGKTLSELRNQDNETEMQKYYELTSIFQFRYTERMED
ncbi:MAG: hypothetical protein JKY44_06105 [Flavobacteriaceae bacterium]|nr:hypothetical protein [Flavobacteriaceae bacterium]